MAHVSRIYPKIAITRPDRLPARYTVGLRVAIKWREEFFEEETLRERERESHLRGTLSSVLTRD